MSKKDIVNLIKELTELKEVENFENQLEQQPLTEDVVAKLPSLVRNRNHQYLMKLRQFGQLVPAKPVPLAEWVKSATGFVVKQSTVDQMEREEYRELIRARLLPSDKLSIYPDIDRNSEIIVHYNFQLSTPNGYVDRRTGGNDMVRVEKQNFDQEQSDNNLGKIRDAQESYASARKEIEYLMSNMESIVEGNFNTQYHNEPVSRFV